MGKEVYIKADTLAEAAEQIISVLQRLVLEAKGLTPDAFSVSETPVAEAESIDPGALREACRKLCVKIAQGPQRTAPVLRVLQEVGGARKLDEVANDRLQAVHTALSKELEAA